ncbi:hypothetical protein AB0K04_11925 [Micromonospora coxensis]|uniref:hypothetical protein n=1 Tax=Micromonospora coxensis TaxID=356852 RepID=UPI00343FBD45
MSPRLPIDAAEATFRDLGGFAVHEAAVPSPDRLLDAVRRFAAVEFDVSPALPEQDGLLFQYATLGDGFVLGVVRQFEVVDADGDHEQYVQLHAEYTLPPDPGRSGHHEDWWFRGGPEPFDAWFARVAADPVWRAVDPAAPDIRFDVWQESV